MKTPARARYAAPAEARRALVSRSLVPERELVKAIPSRAPHGKHPESSRLFDRHVLSPDLAPRLLELGSHLADRPPRSDNCSCIQPVPTGSAIAIAAVRW